MSCEVGAHRLVDGREEGLFSEAHEETEALELVFHRILHLSETQFDAGSVQGVVEFADDIGCGDVDTGDRLCRDHEPSDWGRRSCNSIQDSFMEQLGVRKEERCIPSEQYESRDQARLRISDDVVIALDTVDTAQHGRMRAPAIPEKLDHCNHNCERNAWNGAEHSHPREAGHRKPELPGLDEID